MSAGGAEFLGLFILVEAETRERMAQVSRTVAS